MIFTSEIST